MSPIGKIVKSNSHTDYVCQIYTAGEIAEPPKPVDYAFSTFVSIPMNEGGSLVGLIYDTVLLNPDFGRLGPRLSSEVDLAFFSPDYLNEKLTLVGIAAIGTLMKTGDVLQGVPPVTVNSDTLVYKMTLDQTRAFHAGNPGPNLAYASLLLAQGSPLSPYLLRQVIDRLIELFPSNTALLSVLQTDLIWKSQVAPHGGLQ
ncbi:unnamed protein product [marine sediment metagenome]|uniref:DUF8166 domain-containing protein n=1 Tax=marine sediment metagenome TaxID=412755 RepID=X1A8J5_9ZZZZ